MLIRMNSARSSCKRAGRSKEEVHNVTPTMEITIHRIVALAWIKPNLSKEQKKCYAI